MNNFRPTGAYERGQTVSNEGFRIVDAPNRMILPGELDAIKHENLFFSEIFDLEDPEQKKKYDETMGLIVNRSARVITRHRFDPTPERPTIRVLLEWIETVGRFPKMTPNYKYSREWTA